MIAHDISINAADCKLYPGDPETKIISLQSIEKGDSCNLSCLYPDRLQSPRPQRCARARCRPTQGTPRLRRDRV